MGKEWWDLECWNLEFWREKSYDGGEGVREDDQ